MNATRTGGQPRLYLRRACSKATASAKACVQLTNIQFLLTELSRSVWKNLDRGRKYRPNTRPRSRFSYTDRLSSVDKMFIIWQKQEQFNLLNVTGNWLVLTDILLANVNSSKVYPSSFFLISFLALTEINIV